MVLKEYKEELKRKKNIEKIINEGLTVSDTIKKLRGFTNFQLTDLHSLNGEGGLSLEYFAELADGTAFVDVNRFGEFNNYEHTKYVIHRNDETIVYLLPTIYLQYGRRK